MAYKLDIHKYSNDIQTYVSEKYENIHSELFFDALGKAFEKLKEDYPVKLANEYGINGKLVSELKSELTTEEWDTLVLSGNINTENTFVDNEVEEQYKDFKNGLKDFTLEEFLSDHKIKEIVENDFFMPSKVILRQIHMPNTTYVIDLKEFWNDCQYAKIKKQMKTRLDITENLYNAKIIYIDYANGKSKLRDRMSGDEFWIPNDYLNESVTRHEEFMLTNTFTYKVKNKIYGK